MKKYENALTDVTAPFRGVPTPKMKQIVINADNETHEWLSALAKAEMRSLGNQALHLLGLARKPHLPKSPSRRKAK